MDSEFILTVVLLPAGIVVGFLSWRMPASGKTALGLGLLPLLGMWLSAEFC